MTKTKILSLVPHKFYVVHPVTGKGYTSVSGPYDDQQTALVASAGNPVLAGSDVILFYRNPVIVAGA